MPFEYYARLSPRNQKIYRASDVITQVRLPKPELLFPFVELLREALVAERRPEVEAAAERLVHGIAEMLEVGPASVQVLAARPSSRYGELHGLYTSDPPGIPRIQVWMRTARHRRVVAFRTFLRTLLHEAGHHLDYTYLKLPDSFHTEGFFKRESSLFYQLVPSAMLRGGEPEQAPVRPSGK
jgi:hypothetical protein